MTGRAIETETNSAELPLVVVGAGLAEGMCSLVPGCAAAAVVAVGGRWQLIASRGRVDVAARWPRVVADRVAATDRPEYDLGVLVAPFSAVDAHALLVLSPEADQRVPDGILETVQPLLDGGGVLIDRAAAVQRRDRLVRRVVAACKHHTGPRCRTVADFERAIAALWPGASARFVRLADCDDLAPSTRRLVGAAYSSGQPAAGEEPSQDGLLPPDLRYELAIPAVSWHGAIVIRTDVGGEALDWESVATAATLAAAANDPRLAGPRRGASMAGPEGESFRSDQEPRPDAPQ